MATPSSIAVQHFDNTVSVVYCYFNGFLSGVGATLVTHYDTLEKIEHLISGGSMRSLGNTVEATEYYDHGYEEDETIVFQDLETYYSWFQQQEYNYLWTEFDDKSGKRVEGWMYCTEHDCIDDTCWSSLLPIHYR